jgi:hypothetical protein
MRNKMDREYQKKEAMKDLWSKNERIRELQKENTEIHAILKKTQEKLSLSITIIEATISEMSWKVAEKGLKEVFEA